MGTNAWSHTVTGDYNGDGKADLVVHNATTGVTYLWLMNGGTVASFVDITPSADPAWRHVNLP